MDHLIRSAIRLGAPVAHVYRAATWSAARGFRLYDRGLVAPGHRADLVLLDDLEDCAVNRVIRNGKIVGPHSFDGRPAVTPVGLASVKLEPVADEDFVVPAGGSVQSVIGLEPGRILTEHRRIEVPVVGGRMVADPSRDLLKSASSPAMAATATSAEVSSRASASRKGRWPRRSATTATTSAWSVPATPTCASRSTG